MEKPCRFAKIQLIHDRQLYRWLHLSFSVFHTDRQLPRHLNQLSKPVLPEAIGRALPALDIEMAGCSRHHNQCTDYVHNYVGIPSRAKAPDHLNELS